MILVTVGTNETPFDRLLAGVRGFPAGEEIVVQHGPSGVRPPGATCVDYLPFDALVAHVRRARAVVTHAGVGSIMVCLSNGVCPIVVPRRHRLREAVDDHQVALSQRMAAAGLVTLVEDVDHLADAVAAGAGAASDAQTGVSALAEDVRAYLSARMALPGSSARTAA